MKILSFIIILMYIKTEDNIEDYFVKISILIFNFSLK